MIYPLTGAKRKITGRVEEGKMAPERKKSQTKFGISPFISPQTLPTHKPDSVSDVSNVFIVSSPSPAPNPRKKVGRGQKKKINVIQMCLSPLAWIKGFFQVQCISSRPNLCTLRNATWQSGQGCSFAVLFMSNPSFCSLMLRLTDVFSGSQHTENTWQAEAPGLLGQSTANDMSEMIPQFPERLLHWGESWVR